MKKKINTIQNNKTDITNKYYKVLDAMCKLAKKRSLCFPLYSLNKEINI